MYIDRIIRVIEEARLIPTWSVRSHWDHKSGAKRSLTGHLLKACNVQQHRLFDVDEMIEKHPEWNNRQYSNYIHEQFQSTMGHAFGITQPYHLCRLLELEDAAIKESETFGRHDPAWKILCRKLVNEPRISWM